MRKLKKHSQIIPMTYYTNTGNRNWFELKGPGHSRTDSDRISHNSKKPKELHKSVSGILDAERAKAAAFDRKEQAKHSLGSVEHLGHILVHTLHLAALYQQRDSEWKVARTAYHWSQIFTKTRQALGPRKGPRARGASYSKVTPLRDIGLRYVRTTQGRRAKNGTQRSRQGFRRFHA